MPVPTRALRPLLVGLTLACAPLAAASAQLGSSTVAFAAGAPAPTLPAPAPAPATDPATAPAAAAPAGPVAATTVAGATRARLTLDSRQQAATARLAAEPGPRLGRSPALMIVGGAALVAGLLIGDGAGDAIAIGGAVVGLVGLYQYLR